MFSNLIIDVGFGGPTSFVLITRNKSLGIFSSAMSVLIVLNCRFRSADSSLMAIVLVAKSSPRGKFKSCSELASSESHFRFFGGGDDVRLSTAGVLNVILKNGIGHNDSNNEIL